MPEMIKVTGEKLWYFCYPIYTKSNELAPKNVINVDVVTLNNKITRSRIYRGKNRKSNLLNVHMC